MTYVRFVDHEGDLLSVDPRQVDYVCLNETGAKLTKVSILGRKCYFKTHETVKEITDKIDAALNSVPMPVLLELKTAHTGSMPIFVNPSSIVSITTIQGNGTTWTRIYTEEQSFDVSETASEVADMINVIGKAAEIEQEEKETNKRTLEV